VKQESCYACDVFCGNSWCPFWDINECTDELIELDSTSIIVEWEQLGKNVQTNKN
jgi:hypothetical protein